ncbi:MAG: UMP kinase [Rubricoccaceae bacterium]
MSAHASPLAPLRYRRVLLKLSGEALMGERQFGIDTAVLEQYAADVREAVHAGAEVALVIGGGNIFRGVSPQGRRISSRAHADYMGMLATLINGMALQDALEQAGLHTRLMSAIDMNEIAEPFIRRRAIRHLEKGRVVVFGAGTGHPYFSTDTAAALRAAEIGAEVIIKGTRVDGVYTADPERDDAAQRFEAIHGTEVLTRGLGVMDLTAITLAKESGLPLLVFNMNRRGDLLRLLRGEPVGTLVHWDGAADSAVFSAPSGPSATGAPVTGTSVAS